MTTVLQQGSSGCAGLEVRGDMSLGVKVVGASIWGLSLGVIGLWILMEPALPGYLGMLTRAERVLIGVGMLSGGQLVFLMFVAVRIFGMAPKRLTSTVHWVLLGIGAVCFVLLAGGQLNSGGL